IRRVVALLRDASYRAALAQRAAEFVPTNDARDAAFEALATILPLDALEKALDLGSPRFFQDLTRYDVELDEAVDALKRLGVSDELDAEERRELILRLISEPGVNASLSLRSFQAFARHFPAPASEAEAEALVEAALDVARAAAPFEDERAQLELLKMLPRSELAPRPAEMASALCDLFDALRARSDSIWRGRTILARQLEKANAADTPAVMVRAAAAEVRQEVVEVQRSSSSSSRESYDSTYGD
ncbi:MAG: hypothetical protein WCF57_07025, partial [Pyrinomonadaceae bacterium]